MYYIIEGKSREVCLFQVSSQKLQTQTFSRKLSKFLTKDFCLRFKFQGKSKSFRSFITKSFSQVNKMQNQVEMH